MKYWGMFLAAALVVAGPAQAQEIGAGPGKVEATLVPGGAIFFAGSDTESEFHNYNFGGAFTYNLNRLVGLEGEIGGTLGIKQDLLFKGLTSSQKTPNTLGYSGNIVFSAPVRRRMVPYATAGIGALTLFERTGLGVGDAATLLTGNVGGGLKWYANNRWGLRGDYRLVMVRSSETAPAFFGQERRYGHRIYGGLVLNVGG